MSICMCLVTRFNGMLNCNEANLNGLISDVLIFLHSQSFMSSYQHLCEHCKNHLYFLILCFACDRFPWRALKTVK